MSVIIRLQGLSWSASAMDIRNFFKGLSIPPGGVHIIGGERGDAFIAFSTDEDARRAMLMNNGKLNDMPVMLFLSSKTEMQNTIIEAKEKSTVVAPPAPAPVAISTAPMMGQPLPGQLTGLSGIQHGLPQLPQMNQLSQFLSGLLPNSELTSSVVSKLMGQHQQQQQQQKQQQHQMPVSEAPVSLYKNPYETPFPGEYSTAGNSQTNVPSPNFMNRFGPTESREMSPFGQEQRHTVPPSLVSGNVPGVGRFQNQMTDNRMIAPVNDGRPPWQTNRHETEGRPSDPYQRDKGDRPSFSNTVVPPPNNVPSDNRWSKQEQLSDESYSANQNRPPWSLNRNEPIPRISETEQWNQDYQRNTNNSFGPPTSMYGENRFPSQDDRRENSFPPGNARPPPWSVNRNDPPPPHSESQQNVPEGRLDFRSDLRPPPNMRNMTRWSAPEDTMGQNGSKQDWNQQSKDLPNRDFPQDTFDKPVVDRMNAEQSSIPFQGTPTVSPMHSFDNKVPVSINQSIGINVSQDNTLGSENKREGKISQADVSSSRNVSNTHTVEECDGEVETDEFGRVRRKKPESDKVKSSESSSKKDKRDSRERSRDRDKSKHDSPRRDRDRDRRDRDRRDRDRDRRDRDRDRDRSRRNRDRDDDRRERRRDQDRKNSPASSESNRRSRKRSLSPNSKNETETEKKLQADMQQDQNENTRDRIAPNNQMRTTGPNPLFPVMPPLGSGKGILGTAPPELLQQGSESFTHQPDERPDMKPEFSQHERSIMDGTFNSRSDRWGPEIGEKGVENSRFPENRGEPMDFGRRGTDRRNPDFQRYPIEEDKVPGFRGPPNERSRGSPFDHNFQENRVPPENRRGLPNRGPLLENPPDLRRQMEDQSSNEFMSERNRGPPSLLDDPSVTRPLNDQRIPWDRETHGFDSKRELPPHSRGESLAGRVPGRRPFDDGEEFHDRHPEDPSFMPHRFDGPPHDSDGFADVPPHGRPPGPFDQSQNDRPGDGLRRDSPFRGDNRPMDGPPLERHLHGDRPPPDRPLLDRHMRPPLLEHGRPPPLEQPLHGNGPPTDRPLLGNRPLLDGPVRPLLEHGRPPLHDRPGPRDRPMPDRNLQRPPHIPTEFGGRPRPGHPDIRPPRHFLPDPTTREDQPSDFMGMPQNERPDFRNRPQEDHGDFQQGPGEEMPPDIRRLPFPERENNMNRRRPLLDTPEMLGRMPPGRIEGPEYQSDLNIRPHPNFDRQPEFHEQPFHERRDMRERKFDRPRMFGAEQDVPPKPPSDYNTGRPPHQPRNRNSADRDRETRRDNKTSNERENRRKDTEDKKSDKESKPKRAEGEFCVRIENLPLTSEHGDIRKFLGEIDVAKNGIKLLNDDNGKRTGKAFVSLIDKESRTTALKLSGAVVAKRIISVHQISKADFDNAIDSYEPNSDEEETDRERSKKIDMCNTLTATLMNLKSKGIPSDSNNGSESTDSGNKDVGEFVVKVSQLPEYAVISDIKSMFRECVIANKGSGIFIGGSTRGTRQCFIEFENEDSLQKGLKVRRVFRGNTISITASTRKEMDEFVKDPPTQDRARGQKRAENHQSSIGNRDGTDNGRQTSYDRDKEFHCIRITNLPYDFGYHDFRKLLDGVNIAPRGIQVCHDALKQPLGEGCVELTDYKEAKKALEKDGLIVGRNTIHVEVITKPTLINHMRHARQALRPEMAAEPQVFYFVKASNLQINVKTGEIIDFFHGFNPSPESIRLNVGDQNEKPNSSTALIGFRQRADAERAVDEINNYPLGNRTVSLTKVIL